MQCGVCKRFDCYIAGKDCFGIKDDSIGRYDDPALQKMMAAAEGLAYEGDRLLTRVEELARFAERMGYRHLGIAFCVACGDEAKALHKLFAHKFTVTSVCCCVGGMDKNDVVPAHVEDSGKKVLCNPLGQAEILNRAQTELNIVIGLCVGHDILFAQHSKAPSTTLIVKDRALANNPSGALGSVFLKKQLSERFKK
jgi:uncharacterized metal-binding protein